MEPLLHRDVQFPESSWIPAIRNRLVARFSAAPEGGFQKVEEAIQPLFQEAGYAPILYVKPAPDAQDFQEITINYRGPFEELAMATRLYLPGKQRAMTERDIDSFISLCGNVATALDHFARPRKWFLRRTGSSVVRRPVIPIFDKTREEAAKLSWQYGGFLQNLPNYQKKLKIEVAGIEEADDLSDFLDFIGFHEEPETPRLWFDTPTNTFFQLRQGSALFAMPCVPRTPSPQTVYQNLLDAARRFSTEFGGEVKEDTSAEQVLRGWQSQLRRIRLAPGDEEVREFFFLSR